MPTITAQRTDVISDSVLVPGDAVAAILTLDDGRYVMQLRDNRADIFFPDHWGCFGGAVEPGENEVDALRRELFEELEYVVPGPQRFTKFDFDFSPLGYPVVTRIYFEVRVSTRDFENFVLHEGAEFRAVDGRELLSRYRLTPYDAFAVWMHVKRQQSMGTQVASAEITQNANRKTELT
jgi:8-oxo-dGTP pyrophosphatase MutT (NUDIX family)